MNDPNITAQLAGDPGVVSSALLATMSKREFLLHRIGFLEGAIEGIRLYAIWRNGEQKVGCLEKPLKEVLRPYKEEIARLTNEVANDQAQTPPPNKKGKHAS